VEKYKIGTNPKSKIFYFFFGESVPSGIK